METKTHCKICSDDSIGRYFGTFLCGSCKAFFRRNATKSGKFSCPFTNSCEINKLTRRHCRKCRLEKCFKVGMKKEWITSENTINSNNSTLTNLPVDGLNRLQDLGIKTHSVPSTSGTFVDIKKADPGYKNSSESAGEEDDDDDDDDVNVYGDQIENGEVDGPEGESNAISLMLKNLLDESVLHDLLEEQVDSNMESDLNHLTEDTETINRNIDCYTFNRFGDGQWNSCDDPCEFHQSHREYMTSVAYITNCGNLVCIGSPHSNLYATDQQWKWKVHQRILGANFTPISFRSEFISQRVALNHLEAEKIDELCQFGLGLCNNDPFEFPSVLDLPGFFKMFELSLNRLIPGLNSIPAFASLCLEDRMCLIKRYFADIIFLRAAVLIDIKTETLQIPRTPIILQLRKIKEFANYAYQQFINFIKSIKPNWRTDFKANLLALCILIFNPDTPNVFYPDAIRTQQYNYIYLLRRYLEFRSCLVCLARTDYYDLMMKIGEFQETFKNSEIIHDLVLANIDLVGPLLKEVLNLN